ncbi:DUF6197 family protein [Streptomyces chiangmaiensis]|uniref:DUF6197 family protein n=1 Tax=Streptomyces chiangmaiensis TaxID=766497 RepID=UPI0031ECE080
MARAIATETMAAACPQFVDLKRGMSPATSVAGAERVAFTHALHCPTCGPLADQVRRMQAAQTRRLAAEAEAEATLEAIPILDQTADVIESTGFFRSYLWDTRQAGKGTPLEFCRVDVVGALAIVLYGSPTYAGTPRVRKVEQFLIDRIPAPSLAAWYSRPGVDKRQVLELLRSTADEFRARHGQPAVHGIARRGAA